jgi:hypothetical protein
MKAHTEYLTLNIPSTMAFLNITPQVRIDESHEAPLPHVCPDCGGPLDETHVAQQFQVENSLDSGQVDT